MASPWRILKVLLFYIEPKIEIRKRYAPSKIFWVRHCLTNRARAPANVLNSKISKGRFDTLFSFYCLQRYWILWPIARHFLSNWFLINHTLVGTMSFHNTLKHHNISWFFSFKCWDIRLRRWLVKQETILKLPRVFLKCGYTILISNRFFKNSWPQTQKES